MGYFNSKFQRPREAAVFDGERKPRHPGSPNGHWRMVRRIAHLVLGLVFSLVLVVLVLPPDVTTKWIQLSYSGLVAAGVEYGFDIFLLFCMPVVHYLSLWIRK